MSTKAENIKQYYKQKALQKRQLEHFRKMTKTDVIYRIVNSLATRFNRTKVVKLDTDLTHLQIIGCSYERLKEHLQSQFKEGMSFQNYGEWEVDHIQPICSFDLSQMTNVLKCFNYQNLQPLWRDENRKKGGRFCERSEPSP